MIRKAHEGDILRLAELHREAMPKDFLPRLGTRFLISIFYPALLSDPDTSVWVFDPGSGPQSFVAFSDDPGVITRRLLASPMQLANALVGGFVRHPSILPELFSLAGRRKYDGTRPLPEIYVVATAAKFRRNGYARSLVEHGLFQLEARDFHDACIVRTSSDQAARFYHGLGFTEIGTERRGTRIFKILRKNFASATVRDAGS